MSGSRATYLDSSALVKLVAREPESDALRRYVRRRALVSSALARTEVVRALMPKGVAATQRGADVLGRVELIRITDRILEVAGALQPPELRTLDAIHLATAQVIGSDVAQVVTYDVRMAAAAADRGWRVVRPS